MNLIRQIIVLAGLMMVVPCAYSGESLTLQEYLGRTWRNEAIQLPLSAEDVKHATARHLLIGPDNKPVLYQLLKQPSGAPSSIEILVDLNPGQKNTYKFSDAPDAAVTDLKFEDSPAAINLTNSLAGISIRKKLEPGQAPIASIRLKSGKWVGGSKLDSKLVPTSYTAKVIAEGPVFIAVQCRAEFEGGGAWQLDFRLNANEPVILIDEEMSLGDNKGAFSLSLSENFNPDKLLFRHGRQTLEGGLGRNRHSDIKPGPVYVLEPWVRWWMQINQGACFSVYNEGSPDLLSVAAREAGVWSDPKIPKEKRAPPYAGAIQDNQGLHLDFTLQNGRRKWMVTVLEKDPALEVIRNPNLVHSPSIPYQYLIKHGHFPLNLIKDYVLEWKGDSGVFPRLLITAEQAAKFRATIKADAKSHYEKQMSEYLRLPVQHYNMSQPVAAWFATGNEALGKHLVKNAIEMMQSTVDIFLQQPNEPFGSAPHHHQVIGVAPLLLDAALSTGQVSPDVRQRMLSQLAFMGYTLSRADYWSPERGYGANPNMTTSVYGYKTVISCMLPTHPKAAEWVKDGMAELKNQLDNWSDSNGGWLEAPHYAMVSFDQILSSFVMTKNAGLNEYLYEPKMKKIMSWFSKMSTPPDSRAQGRRHIPPTGNTYIGEPTGEFSLLAYIWKDKDPEFAANMQWMFRQHGSWPDAGIGGSYPGFAGYRAIFHDSTIPEKAPQYESEIFPNTNVLLRSNFPSERETHLNLLAGSFNGYRSHWDDDSGSYTLWGKGRIIADDYGYYGLAPADDHNLLDAPEVKGNQIFKVSVFAPSKRFDYVSGGRGPWQRQIAFIKDEDPMAPNYFVISDSAKTAKPGTLRLWLTASKVTAGSNTALVEGKDDVDTDIFFTTPPPAPLKTEERTRTSGAGINAEGKQGPTPTTQIGLIASTPVDGATTYVLFPRLKTEKPAAFTSLADGKAVKIESSAGTDYVFLSATPFTFKDGAISFEGRSACIRVRGKQMVLSLGESGTITAFGETLSGKEAASREVKLP